MFLLLITLPVLAYLGTFGKSSDSPPSVSTNSATEVTTDTARLNGRNGLLNVTQVGFNYGQTTSYGDNAVAQHTELLEVVDSVLAQGVGAGQFSSPHGVEVDSLDNIYIVDRQNHRIQKFDSGGNYILQWGTEGFGQGQFDNPYHMAIDNNDNVYVTDGGSNRVQKFDSEGNFLLQWGSTGQNPEQFYNIWDIEADSIGNLYVVNSGGTLFKSRVQKYDSNGNYLTGWESNGPSTGVDPAIINTITLDGDDNVYTAEGNNGHRIQKFDSEGNFITQWGSFGYYGDGEIVNPEGMTFGSDGLLYVSTGISVIQSFQPNGAFVNRWDMDGSFSVMRGIALDSNGRIVAVDSFGSSSVGFRVLEQSFSAELTNLTCNTTYHHRAYAINANGTAYGNDQTFTTLACPGGIGIPQNLSGTSQVTSIEVDWDDVSGANTYELEYKQSSSITWTEYTANPITGSFLELTGLNPETSYDIRVKAVDLDANESDWSNVLTISTLAQQTYTITDCEELQAIAIDRQTFEFGDPSGRYVLANDIDCSDTVNWNWDGFVPDGTPNPGFLSIYRHETQGAFTGDFEGAGYTVSGVFQRPVITSAGGLFAMVAESSIQNVSLTDLQIIGGEIIQGGDGFVGGLIGNGARVDISNVSVSGNVSVTAGNTGLALQYGGLAGMLLFSEVSSSRADVQANAVVAPSYIPDAPITTGLIVGGLLGSSNNNLITDTYSIGQLITTANDQFTIVAGGLVGAVTQLWFEGENPVTQLSSSYSATDILTGGTVSQVGGLVGLVSEVWDDENSVVGIGELNLSNSFAYGELNQGSEGGFIGGLIAAMQGDLNYTTITNNYYDLTRTNLESEKCVDLVTDRQGNPVTNFDIGCNFINQNNSQPTYFFNNTCNPPLDKWDFTSIWKVQRTNAPMFTIDLTASPQPCGTNPPTVDPDNPTNPNPDTPGGGSGGGGSGGGATTPPTTPSPGTDSSGNPPTNPGSSEAPLTTNLFVQGASMGPLERFIQSIPTAIARSIPWTILLLLIALSLYYVYLAYLEEERRKELRALIARFKTTQQARASYLDITSHYINTPLSVMQGTVQVLASKKAINEELNVAATSQLNKLSKQVQSLLAQAQQTSVGQGAVVASLERTTITSLITQPYVWVPLAVSYSLAILANFVFIQADKYEPSLITFGAQIGIAIVGMLAIVSSVYYWQRMKHAKRLVAEELELEKQYSYQQAEFISSAYETLSADLTALNVLGTTIVQHPQGKPFAEALAKLEKTVFKLETLGQLARNVPGQTWKTDVNQAIEAALTEARQVADAKQVTITTHIEPHLLANIGEAGLVHVIRAPLMNAIQFSSPGSKIEFTALPTENSIVLTTTDHGQGMDQATQDKLFQPFSRSSTEQFNYEGMGLDLYLTRVILEQYGGTIAATSVVGEGVRVVVVLSEASSKVA